MKLEDYESLDGPSSADVERLFQRWTEDRESDSTLLAAKKLDALGDAQWHTYEVPHDFVRSEITDWLKDTLLSLGTNEIPTDLAEHLLGICYCFALDKQLFIQVFEQYAGDSKDEFFEILEHSPDDTIDPFWSMRQYE